MSSAEIAEMVMASTVYGEKALRDALRVAADFWTEASDTRGDAIRLLLDSGDPISIEVCPWRDTVRIYWSSDRIDADSIHTLKSARGPHVRVRERGRDYQSFVTVILLASNWQWVPTARGSWRFNDDWGPVEPRKKKVRRPLAIGDSL